MLFDLIHISKSRFILSVTIRFSTSLILVSFQSSLLIGLPLSTPFSIPCDGYTVGEHFYEPLLVVTYLARCLPSFLRDLCFSFVPGFTVGSAWLCVDWQEVIIGRRHNPTAVCQRQTPGANTISHLSGLRCDS
jgi:hypothetical protein